MNKEIIKKLAENNLIVSSLGFTLSNKSFGYKLVCNRTDKVLVSRFYSVRDLEYKLGENEYSALVRSIVCS